MKNLIIFILCIVSSQQMFAQWTSVNLPNIAYFHSSYFVNDDFGFLLLPGGTVERTDDAGMTWDSIGSTYIYSWFNAAHFINDSVGYIGGGANFPFPPSSVSDLILKTTDGGLSFDSIYGTYSGSDITNIEFADENHGMFLSSYVSYKTDDGGQTLDTLGLDYTNTLSYGKDLAYPSLNSAYASGFQTNTGPNANDLFIFKSTNQGDDWSLLVVDTGTSNNTHIDFVDDDNGFMVAQGGRFYKTSNGGNSWTKQVLDASLIFSEIRFASPNLGFLLGYQNDTSYLYSTVDGGDSWQIELIDTAFSATSISITTHNLYVGGFKKLYKRNIDSFMVGISKLVPEYQFELYPNPSDAIIHISFSKQLASSYAIRDYSGRTILEDELSSHQNTIDISSLASGVYTLSISSHDKFLGSRKLLVK